MALGRLGPSGLVAKMANMAPSWRPKRLQNRGRNPKKSMLKNNTFLTSIFSSFGLRFARVFGRFFGSKMHENSKNTFLAKTLKIVVFPRENWYFQGFRDNKNTKTVAKNFEKIDIFWNIDFEGVLGGFGDAKNLDFSRVFQAKSTTKKHDVLEGPRKFPRRGKKLPPEALSRSDPSGAGLLSGSWVAGGGVGEVQPKRTNWLSNTPLGQRPGEFYLVWTLLDASEYSKN